MSFVEIEKKPYVFTAYEPWWKEGFLHGYCGASMDFAKARRDDAKLAFNAAFGTEKLYLLRQAHTDNLVQITGEDIARGTDFASVFDTADADAITVSGKISRSGRIAFGVMSADCMPLIIRSGANFALVHSGWRGLANGIILKVMQAVAVSSDTEVIIGPCAGPQRYEVGQEVLRQIGPSAVYAPLTGIKGMLDMARTAANQISAAFGPTVRVQVISRCTISNASYHSFRRDGDAAGRNLAFVVT